MPDDGRNRKGGAPDRDAVAKAELQLFEKARVKGGASLHDGRKIPFLEGHGAVKRIFPVNGLEVHERLGAAIGLARHRPHSGNLCDFALRRQIGALGGVRLPVDQNRLHVAAQQLFALARDRVLDGAR